MLQGKPKLIKTKHYLNDEANSQSGPPSSETGDSQILVVLKWRFGKDCSEELGLLGSVQKGGSSTGGLFISA